MKRVLIVSDYHCGHLVGLTPPGWQLTPTEIKEVGDKRDKFIAVQKSCWNFYADSIKRHGPFDVVIANGDLIDGSGARSGGTEQSAVDRLLQCEMAERSINETGTKAKKYITIGTAYHTGDAEDFETIIARGCGAETIGSHEWIDVEGVVFDVKHHCGSSAVPHTRHTAIAREHLWNQLWAERGLQPRAQVIIRSHVHYYNFCGGPGWVAMTTPALQGYGTKYGSRRCSGIVDFGMIIFECHKGSYSWTPLIAKLPAMEARITKA